MTTEAGNGAQFGFLHGGGQGGWVWDRTIAALKLQTGGSVRTLALDVPGCGSKRARDTSGLGPDEIAAELIADLESAGMTDVILVGHSQAGNILPRMAALCPALFERLVYLSCSIPRPGQTVLEMMGSGVHGSNPDEVGWPSEARAGEMRARYAKLFCNDMGIAEATAFLGRLGADNWPALSYTATDWTEGGVAGVPATYLVCLRDAVLPVAWQERFAARFGAERIVRIDAAHQAMNTRPQTLAEILLLESIARKSGSVFPN